MTGKITAPMVKAMKGRGEPIVCVTAYDVMTASIADEAGVEVVLVGDSLGNVVLGYETTIPVSLVQMAHHTSAARRGVANALLVSDMPFGSYQCSTSMAVESAIVLAKAGAEAVKLEGTYISEIGAIVKAGLPVMGHLGMTPQSVNLWGGHRVQGKGSTGASLVEDAKRLEEAGCFSMVLELIPAELAERITGAVSIPTIGIGAGSECDGQIQVFHDVVGLGKQSFKHAKAYAEARNVILRGIQDYACEVRSKAFPTSEHSF